MKDKVVILGAGPAGLSAGWRLSEKGVNVQILEAEPYVGGLSRTIHRAGYLFDLGPHRFHTDNSAILAEVERLTGQMPERARKTRVYFMNRYYDYPLSAGNLLSSLPLWLGFACVADFFATWVQNRLRPAADESFESWVTNRFGRRLYDIYFGPYTAKVWGRDPSRLSASWAVQRVAVVDLWDLILRTLKIRRGYNHFHHSPYKPDFHYPPTGVGTIYRRMAEEIARNGGEVILGARVREVVWANDRVQALIVEQDGYSRQVGGDFFVSTLPISLFAKSFRPLPGDNVLSAANSLRYRAMIFLFLTLDKESVSDDHWIYFPERDVVFNRISEMKNFSPFAAPPGKTSLVVEITCDPGDELWSASEEELYARSVQGLVDARLIESSDVLDHFFLRTEHAYPTYDLDFEANLGTLTSYLAGFHNLLVCGRQGLFRYINQDHAIEMGLAAADEILAHDTGTRVGLVGSQRVYFG